MIVAVYNHRGIAQPFIDALHAAGHAVVDAVQALDAEADVLLVDLDHPNYQHLIDRHDKVVLIPHGAGGVDPDGQRSPNVVGRVVTADGPADLAGGDVPCEIVGWPWCEQRTFRPCETSTRVLMAPYHPDNDGYVPGLWRAAESRALEVVLAAAPAQINLRYRPGPSTIHETVADLPDYDLVLAAPGTLPAVAVALGIPTVVYGQDLFDRNPDDVDGRYPWDTTAGAAAVQHALTVEATAWRQRWVGEPWDPARFVAAVEKWAA